MKDWDKLDDMLPLWASKEDAAPSDHAKMPRNDEAFMIYSRFTPG